MTEMSDKKKMSPAVERFILKWGDMGDGWGVNRSVSQIHGLLYLAERPMTAEDIADTLGMARSNVSNSLKELLAWDLIRRVPILGDRRDHFEAETDIWEVAQRIAKGRKEREIDPAIRAIDLCVGQAETEKSLHPVTLARMREMQDFLTTADRWWDQMFAVPKAKLATLIRMGDKVLALLKIGGKKAG